MKRTKILAALIIAPALFAVGWVVIGTNIWGVPFGPSTYINPADTYAVTYVAATKSYELRAGGGGGVTAVNGGTGISTGISGTTVTVTNTGVVAAKGQKGITVNGIDNTKDLFFYLIPRHLQSFKPERNIFFDRKPGQECK